jgi:hypothetical protein
MTRETGKPLQDHHLPHSLAAVGDAAGGIAKRFDRGGGGS